MYKQFDVVTLKTGERVTIIEVYDHNNFMVEKELSNEESDVVDVTSDDIERS
jgi:hypothetical protein